MPSQSLSILIASSKPDFLLTFPLIRASGFEDIQECESIPQALKMALASRPDQQSPCILVDRELLEFSEFTALVKKEEALKQLQQVSQNFVPLIILIEAKQEEIVAPLKLDYLIKESLTQEFLNFAIQQAIAKATLNQKLAEAALQLQQYQIKHKRNKRARVKSLKKFIYPYKFQSQILAQVSDAVVVINNDYQVSYCNDSALKQYQLQSDQMIGKNLSECYEFKWVNPEDEHLAMRAIQTQAYWQGINIHRLLNGKELLVESKVTLLKDENGNSIGFLAIIRDITEQKLAEQSLKDSELKLRKLTDNIPVALYQFLLKPDGSMSFPFTSQGTYSLYELFPETIQADANVMFSLVHPLDMEPLYDSIRISAQTLETWRWEGRIYTTSGKLKWISGISQPELLANGDILWHGMIRDISDRKQAELELEAKNAEIDRFFSVALDLLCIANIDGYFLRLNPHWQTTLGYSLEQLQGSQFLNYVHPEDVKSTLEAISLLSSQQSIPKFVNRYRCHDGSYRWIEWRAVPSGNLIYSAARDITERKQMEEKLRYRIEYQNVLMTLTQQIRQSLNLNLILETTVTEVKRILNCDRVIIYQFCENGLSKIVKEAVSPNYPAILHSSWQDKHLTSEMFEYFINSNILIENNISECSVFKDLLEYMQEAKIKSKIISPITNPIDNKGEHTKWQSHDKKLWGLLIVHSCEKLRQWQPEEAELLEQIANQLAISIQQASLYQQLQNQATADRIVTEVTLIINQSNSVKEALDPILKKANEFLHCDRIQIFQLDSDRSGYVLKEEVCCPELSMLNIMFKDNYFAPKEIATEYLHGQVTCINDVQNDPNINPCHAEILQQYQVKANLVAPILLGDRLWGLLIVHECYDPRYWQPLEINFIQQIAMQISTAVQKENLYLQICNELEQKKILLREIHHRVKNNLQIMSSILFLQFRNSPPETQIRIEQYQGRLESMALIHDQLYRSDNLSLIDFSTYIHNLTRNLLQCYYPNPDLLELKINVNNVSLSLDQSIPLGLIINELVSNSLKYAFPNQYGKINIQLQTTSTSLILLVSDNGIGVSKDFSLDTSQNLGLQLVQSLTEQLEGDFSFDSKNGFNVQITFPINSTLHSGYAVC